MEARSRRRREDAVREERAREDAVETREREGRLIRQLMTGAIASQGTLNQ